MPLNVPPPTCDAASFAAKLAVAEAKSLVDFGLGGGSVNVMCETGPHYLVLTEDDLRQLGAVAKYAPPLRPQTAQDSLWEFLKSGSVATAGSAWG